MANTIKIKNSGQTGNVPSSLDYGEIAINYADGKIFYKNNSNTIVSFTLSGGVTVSDTPPSSPTQGSIWYESDTGSLFTYYDSFWIEIGGSAAYDQIIGSIQSKGDLLAGTGSQSISRIAVGSNGKKLSANSSTTTGLEWVDDSNNTVIDAKGDLLVGLADNSLSKLSVGSNGQMLIADSSQATGLGWTDVNNKNLVFNGAMQVSQRGTSVAGITADSYNTADRWGVGISNLGTWTQSVETHTSPTDDVVLRQGFRRSLKMLCTTAKVTPTTNDEAGLVYKFEGQDLQSIAKGTSSAKSLTLSFWVKSNVTGTYIVELMDDDNSNRHVNKSYTISAANTWEYKTITFPPDTTGLLDNDNAQSMRLHYWFATGTNYNSGSLQTSWGALSQTSRAVGQVNLASAINNYFQITGIQLNVGTVAAPFEFKRYEQELRECQRYYWRKTSSVAYQPIGFGMADATTAADINISFPVPMRDAPSAFDWNALRLCDYQNAVVPTSWAIIGYRTSSTMATMAVYTSGSLVQYRPYILEGNNTSSAFFGMSAEL